MKFLIILALFTAIVLTHPVEEFSQDQEMAEPLLFVADLDFNNLDYENVESGRQKRQFDGFPNHFFHGQFNGQNSIYPTEIGFSGQQRAGFSGQQGAGFSGQNVGISTGNQGHSGRGHYSGK
ncbi:unnamed protein product [Chironomus riparius]|uniref:Uncharacterized protein n=1 Tax=Chironomus riparius TaxID=315576 RepID=A0A9N9RI98_9DIPT|nr:unnamed protein product [Chironomus riparius]